MSIFNSPRRAEKKQVGPMPTRDYPPTGDYPDCCCPNCFWEQPPAFFAGLVFGVAFNAAILTLAVKFLIS